MFVLCAFIYPVCIDEKDSLNKLNHFPSDMMSHTFLLNKENRVIAIGNPIHNPKIKELYFKIIKGEDFTLYEYMLQTSVVFDKIEKDLKTFSWKQEQVADFILTNTGNELLVIEGVSTSCGCTTVEYSKKPIQPNKNLILKVKYKAGQPEHFNKTITVYCNTKDSPLEKVLRHYQQYLADSLKYKLLAFLIENMPYYTYLVGKQLDNYKSYFLRQKKR